MEKLRNFIECALDGKNKKFTLNEIHVLIEVYNELVKLGSTCTFIKSVADICEIAGLRVYMANDNVNYIIHSK